jgi:hypothetical protein
MRRFVPILLAGAALIAAACGESIAPKRSVDLHSFGAPVVYTQTWDPSTPTWTATFVMDPAGGRVTIGEFTLDYPANAVCNPATSGYGPTTWDRPCETLDSPVEFTARLWWQADGSVFIELSPDVRFAPDKEVTISITRPWTDEELARRTLYYFKNIGTTTYVIDEAAVDEDVTTHYDAELNRLERRVKHFSGIVLNSGRIVEEVVEECFDLCP